MNITNKVDYVKTQGQSRKHHCHWPNCHVEVPPAKWGCTTHWFKLPFELRSAIWQTFEPGQEVTATPSAAYIAVARRVQDWIKANHPNG